MTSLGTDFEMHAYWQGYAEELAAKKLEQGTTTLSHQTKYKDPTGTGSSVKSTVEIRQKLS
jgi:hypothetical protein